MKLILTECGTNVRISQQDTPLTSQAFQSRLIKFRSELSVGSF